MSRHEVEAQAPWKWAQHEANNSAYAAYADYADYAECGVRSKIDKLSAAEKDTLHWLLVLARHEIGYNTGCEERESFYQRRYRDAEKLVKKIEQLLG